MILLSLVDESNDQLKNLEFRKIQEPTLEKIIGIFSKDFPKKYCKNESDPKINKKKFIDFIIEIVLYFEEFQLDFNSY